MVLLAFGATTLNGSPTFNISSNSSAAASLSLGAITDSGGRTLTLKGNGAFAQSGVFAGNLGLSLDATYFGVSTLSQANTFSGGTIVSGGTLKIGTTSFYTSPNITSGATGTGNVTLGGCSVDASSGNTLYVPTLTLNGDINVIGGNRLTTSFSTLDLGGATRKINVNSKSIVITNLPGGVSWASTNSSGTTNSENTGISSWEIASTLGNLTVQNGTVDLETTAYSGGYGGSYGAFRFSSGSGFMNFTGNGNLIVGNSVVLLCNGSFNGAAAPKLTINAGGFVDAVDADLTIYSLAGGGNYAVSLVTNTSSAKTLTINGSAGSTTFSGTLQDGPAPGSAKLNLAKSGASTQILNGNNTYSGNTFVNAGTLALTGNGSIACSAVISVNSGAVFDVSGLSSTFVLGSAQSLSNSAAATGTLNGNVNTANGTLSLGFAPGTAALNVTNGTLTLSKNTIVVVNNTGTVLGAGSYKLIAKLTGGAVAGTAPAVTVSGNGGSGSASLQIVSGELYLVVGANLLNLGSSPNQTNGYLAPVTFTATVQTNGVTAGNASGTVTFFTNSVAFTTNGLVGGTTNFSLSILPRGTNLITAIYSGDSNYLSSTNTLNQIVTNHPPMAVDATYYRAKGLSLKIAMTNLLTNVTDADGDTNTLQSVGTGLTNATILTDSTYIYYLPGTGAGSNDNDVISYTVSDGFGGTATANILVNVYSATGPAQMSLPTNGVVNIKFFGIPNYTYVVQTTTNVSGPWWTISTNTAGTNGYWLFTDPNATNTEQYYRSAQP